VGRVRRNRESIYFQQALPADPLNSSIANGRGMPKIIPPYVFIFGLVSTALYLGIWQLSLQFNWGKGYADRPILSYLAVYILLFALYAFFCNRIRQKGADSKLFWTILVLGLLFRGAIFPSQQIQEDDVYRYLWDGKVFSRGINPFKFAPSEISYATEFRIRHPIGFRTEYDEESRGQLDFLDKLRWENQTALLYFERINHPDVPTIYPPLAQFTFRGVAHIRPDNIYALRLAFLSFDLLALFFIVKTLRALGKNPNLCAIYFLCPLVIKETFNSTHLDIIGIAFLCAAVYFFVKKHSLSSGIFLGLSFLGKLYPIILAPIFFKRFLVDQETGEYAHWGRACAVAIAFLATAILGYLPFLDIGWKTFSGLNTFTATWQNNDSLFAMILWFWRDLVALSPDTVLFNKYPLSEFFAKANVALILLGVLGYLFFSKRVESSEEGVKHLFIMMGLVFLLSPVQNPWYLCWTVPFLCFFPWRSWIFLTGLMGMYYLDFYFDYQDIGQYSAWIPLFEYTPFYVYFAYECIKNFQSNRDTLNPRQQLEL
jgi:alpha-1,6-mannosyltransferase